MITPRLEELIDENYKNIWGDVMKSLKSFRKTEDEENAKKTAWELAVINFHLEGISWIELRDAVMRRVQKLGNDARKSPKKTELQILKQQKKDIDKKIKDIERATFHGSHFRVMTGARGRTGFRLQANISHKFETIAWMSQDEANYAAKKLEEAWAVLC
jgi:hypothetical protein